jgi:outer membrane lipoprotein-sorting protein
MKRTLLNIAAAFGFLTLAVVAQAQNDLESVLSKMDAAAATFKSAQADFVWDQFQLVVQETTTQKGQIFFEKKGGSTLMSADITDDTGGKRYILFNGSKLQLFQPKIDQITEYDTGKNKEAVESFLVIGFGGRGHDLQKQFTVKFAGMESVQGVNAAKLELTPKAENVRKMFKTITLWIDPARGVSVQQKFLEPAGDYRLAKYTNIKINEKISGEKFKFKTTGKTKTVKPQG